MNRYLEFKVLAVCLEISVKMIQQFRFFKFCIKNLTSK